jgi:hypothetical protein
MAIHCYPMMADSGRPDVVVGKEDGLIELYAVDENDTVGILDGMRFKLYSV